MSQMPVGLTLEQYKRWIKDVLKGFIPSGGVCANGCVYCTLKSNFGCVGKKSWCNFISQEDLYHGLQLLNEFTPDIREVDIGSGSGLIQSEPFFHPHYLDLVKLTRSFFPRQHIFTFTLGRHARDFSALRDLGWKCGLTLNTLDPELRSQIMIGEEDMSSVLELLRNEDLIKSVFIVWHGDLEAFKRDLDKLHNISPAYLTKGLCLFPIGYTRATENTPRVRLFAERGAATMKEALSWGRSQGFMIDSNRCYLNDDIDAQPDDYTPMFIDEWKADFDGRIHAIQKQLTQIGLSPDEVGYLFSESVWSYAEEKHPDIHTKIKVKNITYGGNVCVASLLGLKDFEAAIQNSKKKYSYYVVSRDAFSNYCEDITEIRYQDYPFKVILA